MLPEKVIKAGQQIADDLISAQVSHKMGNMGGHVVKPISEYENRDADNYKQYEEVVIPGETPTTPKMRSRKTRMPTRSSSKLQPIPYWIP